MNRLSVNQRVHHFLSTTTTTTINNKQTNKYATEHTSNWVGWLAVTAVLTATSPQIWFREDLHSMKLAEAEIRQKEAPASYIIYISLFGVIFPVLWSVFPHLIWQKPGNISTCLYQLWEPTKGWKCEQFPLRHFNPEDWLFCFLLLGWSFFRWHHPFEMDIWLLPELKLVWCKLFGSWWLVLY